MTPQYYLPPFLEAFHNKYPKARKGIMNLTNPATIGSLREGKRDLGGRPAGRKLQRASVRDVAQIQDVFLAGERLRPLRESVCRRANYAVSDRLSCKRERVRASI